MDAFEPVRAAARALRERVAGAGDDLDATSIVRAALADRGLRLRSCPAGDPELEGALGLLCRQFGEVLHDETLTPDAAAEAVAHEIGHAVLHDGPEAGYHMRSEANGGDPLQRIETYGSKERREAQANVFARELVLPRAVAKRLFLSGMGASAISRAANVRYATALQQIADGVLLPDARPATAEAQGAPTPMNPSQERAAAHRGGPFLVSAGPGTGKTKTLVGRIVGLIREGIPPSQILALTFSNRAARELGQRVEAEVGTSSVNVWAGTFHAFGLDTVRKHHGLFGLPPDPRVVDGSLAIELLEDSLPALGLRHHLNLFEPALALRDILRAISRAKDELCTPERYAELARAMLAAAADDEDRVRAERAAEVATVYAHYQAQLERMRAVDYGDVIMRPTTMMRSDADFRALMRSRFTHVHVDEYQDVNRASAMMVRELVGDGDNLWVVGDARQSLYRFRGASAVNVARFEQDYPKGRRDALDVNYRSSRAIVEAFCGFGRTMAVSRHAGGAELTAARGEAGPAASIGTHADTDAEMDALAGSIRSLERGGVPLNEQTVLARSNGTLARAAAELEARDVPVLYLGPIFDRDEVRDLLSVLALVADASGGSLVRVGALPEYGVPLADSLAVIGHARRTETRVLDLLTGLETVSGLSPAGRTGLRTLASHLAGATPGTAPWLLVSRFLFDGSNYVRTVLSGQRPSDDMRRVAARQLLDCLRSMPTGGGTPPVRAALDRIRNMILLADERDLRQLPPELDGLDGVRMMTVHASKGLEFRAVHLPCLQAGAIPSANRPPACPPPASMVEGEDEGAHEAEEECVLFVAMSRARDRLLAYRPLTRNGRTANPSRFLERVPFARSPGVPPVARASPAPDWDPITSPAAPLDLSGSDIENYASCARRFLYDRVMGLRNRGRDTAFLQAHGCIQSVLAHVRELGTGEDYDHGRALAVFEDAWSATALDDHAFGQQYRALAMAMMARVQTAATGGAGRVELITQLAGETVRLSPDRVLDTDGTPVVRGIRSGKGSASDADRLGATLMLKAVGETLGASARVETHYLTSGDVLAVTQTPAKRAKRIADCESAIGGIRRGHYPPVRDDFRCPRCPHLFTCAAPTSQGATTVPQA